MKVMFLLQTLDSKWLNWLKYSIHFPNFYFFSQAAMLAAIFCFSSVNLLTG